MKVLKDRGEVHEFLELHGFDQIKLPGGTERTKAHYSGVVVYTVSPDGEVFFLGLPYDSKHHFGVHDVPSTKIAGERPVATAMRELHEETGILLNEDKFTEVFRFSPPRSFHVKYFFVTSITKGFEKIFDFSEASDGRNPNDKETGTPVWLSANLMKQVLWDGHQKAFIEAVKHMCKDPYLGKRIFQVLESQYV